jgi:hypothetical protein
MQAEKALAGVVPRLGSEPYAGEYHDGEEVVRISRADKLATFTRNRAFFYFKPTSGDLKVSGWSLG